MAASNKFYLFRDKLLNETELDSRINLLFNVGTVTELGIKDDNLCAEWANKALLQLGIYLTTTKNNPTARGGINAWTLFCTLAESNNLGGTFKYIDTSLIFRGISSLNSLDLSQPTITNNELNSLGVADGSLLFGYSTGSPFSSMSYNDPTGDLNNISKLDNINKMKKNTLGFKKGLLGGKVPITHVGVFAKPTKTSSTPIFYNYMLKIVYKRPSTYFYPVAYWDFKKFIKNNT